MNRGLITNFSNSERRSRVPAIRKSGAVMAQWSVRFRTQLAMQPIATARQIVAAEDGWSGYQ